MKLNISNVVAGVIDLGKVLVSMDPRVTGTIAAVKKVIEIVDEIKDTAEMPKAKVTELAETREALEQRVAEHVERVAHKIAD